MELRMASKHCQVYPVANNRLHAQYDGGYDIVRRDPVTSLDKISVLRKIKVDLPMCGSPINVWRLVVVSALVKAMDLSDDVLYSVALWVAVAQHSDKSQRLAGSLCGTGGYSDYRLPRVLDHLEYTTLRKRYRKKSSFLLMISSLSSPPV